MALTAKQERFAREFLLDGNAARAAVAAGYAKTRGKQTGAELLRNDGVRALIAELGKAKAAELDLSHDYVIEGFLHYDQGAREGRYRGVSDTGPVCQVVSDTPTPGASSIGNGRCYETPSAGPRSSSSRLTHGALG